MKDKGLFYGTKELLLCLLNNELLLKGKSSRNGAELWRNITADDQSDQSAASWPRVCTKLHLRYSKIEKTLLVN